MFNVCKEGVASVDPITAPVKRVCTIVNICCARLSAVGCSRHNVGSGLPSLKGAFGDCVILARWTNHTTGLPDMVTDQASCQGLPCMFVIIFPWRWYDWGWGSGWGIVIVIVVIIVIVTFRWRSTRWGGKLISLCIIVYYKINLYISFAFSFIIM